MSNQGPEDVGEEESDEFQLRVGNKLLKKIAIDLCCSFSCFFSCWEFKEISSPSSGNTKFKFKFKNCVGDNTKSESRTVVRSKVAMKRKGRKVKFEGRKK